MGAASLESSELWNKIVCVSDDVSPLLSVPFYYQIRYIWWFLLRSGNLNITMEGSNGFPQFDHQRGGRMDKSFGLNAGRSGVRIPGWSKCSLRTIAVDAKVKYPLYLLQFDSKHNSLWLTPTEFNPSVLFSIYMVMYRTSNYSHPGMAQICTYFCNDFFQTFLIFQYFLWWV